MKAPVGIFWVDPGGSTGVAWGIFDRQADTVKAAMAGRKSSGSATVHHGRVEGSNPEDLARIIRLQTADVLDLYSDFLSKNWSYIDNGVHFAFGMEHFILTPSPHHKPGFEGIFPAYLIGAMMTAMPDEEIELQSAATGMKWNHRKYLSNYNAWIVGKEHERAAFAHIAAYLHAHLR